MSESKHYYHLDITKEDFKNALLADGLLNESDIDLIKYHYSRPNHEATATQLSIFFHHKKYTAVNLHFARISKKICKYTGKYPYQGENGKYWWWTLLANGRSDGRYFIWELRPELIDAIEEIGFIEDQKLPEEISDTVGHLKEGMVKQILVNSYEMNPIARKKCIEKYGPVCSVCGFNFEKVYGELGKGFIHIHHITPICEIDREYIVDPLKDLRPLCPNCHAMIHKPEKILSIEELREIIKKL